MSKPVLKYNSKYKSLYVSQGAVFEFEGNYKVEKTKVTFSGKLISTASQIQDKETGNILSDLPQDVLTFDLYLEDTKVTIKETEYTFRTFDSFQLLYKYLQHLDITENIPFRGVLNFGLNPNWLEILSNGLDDFGNKVSSEIIYNLIADKCQIVKLDNLSFELPASQGNKSYQNFKVSEYQRLSDRYKFFTEKLGVINPDEHDIFSIAELINERNDEDDYDIIVLFNLLMGK